jgi:hypothetical protein
MGISNSDLIDLQRTTLENLPRMNFETALTHQSYEVINDWFRSDKVQSESGTSIERNILLDNSGNARHVRLFQRSSINIADVQHKITAPWVQVEGQYSIERREALRNRKPAAYINLLKSRRMDAMLAMADLLEERAWLTPNSTTDDVNPRGITYWLSKVIESDQTSYDAAIDIATGAFSGRKIIYGDTTEVINSKGGINPTTQDKWRNWAATFSGFDTNLSKALRKAFFATKFQSPLLVSDLKSGPLSKFRIYMNLSSITDFEEYITGLNDISVGSDLGKFHGITAFRRVPLVYASQLDTDADNPVYGVNHAKFYPIVQSGDWMRESEPMSDVEMHNVITTFVDGSYQFFASNVREAGFVLHKPQ